MKIILAHLGHPYEGECIVTIRKHENVFADVSALHYRPWQLYNSLMLAQEYGVWHKLLFGTDFPFTTVNASIAGIRALNDMLEGTKLPRLDTAQIEAHDPSRQPALLGLESERMRTPPAPKAHAAEPLPLRAGLGDITPPAASTTACGARRSTSAPPACTVRCARRWRCSSRCDPRRRTQQILLALDHCVLGAVEHEQLVDAGRASERAAEGDDPRRVLAHAWRGLDGTGPRVVARRRLDSRICVAGERAGELVKQCLGSLAAGRHRLWPRPLQPRGASRFLGRRAAAVRLRLQSRRARGRHRARRARHGGRWQAAGQHRELRLPSDDAGLGQHAHQPRLHRRHARGGGARHGRAVPVPARRVRRTRPARGLRRRHGRGRSQRPRARLCRAVRAHGAAAGGHELLLHRPGRLRRDARRLDA